MQISPDTLRLLMELDCPTEQKIALMKAMEADWLAYQSPAVLNGSNEERERVRNASTYAERKRAKDRERQRRLREESRQSRDVANNRAMSRDIDGDPPATLGDSRGDPATPRAHVRDITPKLDTTGVLGGGVGLAREPETDWPEGEPSEKLIAEVASPWLDPQKTPGLVTTRGRVSAWKRDGASWEHDVVPVVKAECLRRRQPVASWKYFDQAIARSVADNRRALEIPEAGNVVPLPRGQGPPRTIDEKISASWDYAIEKIARDEQS